MAERRMFAKSVVNSDSFLEMPQSTQNLYFHLGIHGDDDGFIDSPKRIMRMLGASEDDFKLLILKQFIIPFDSGVVVVRHWKMHNYIRNDRYKPTQYQLEKALLMESNSTYNLRLTDGIPSDDQESTDCLPDGCIMEGRGTEENKEESILPGAETTPDRQEPPAIEIILNDGTYHAVYPSEVERWASLYPAVDIMAELRKMAGWSEANKTKRKTTRGVSKFINAWLAREQDKGGSGAKTDSSAGADGTPHPAGGIWLGGRQVVGVQR